MKDVVQERIEHLREKMVMLAIEKGLTDPEVIAISQEIDKLHNIWNHLGNQALTQHRVYKSADSGQTHKLIRDFSYGLFIFKSSFQPIGHAYT
ncbi:Sporulation stage 0, Spo0E-like regulatory phosphatase [Caldalkalibacillus thermarum TA2.A1]|uniref:Aspartyl-phosphate phosphatase Spo0E family protein n=1 Tax=Caldalkalibacillus thermarum (strain TA2.A1) TaxID=986075 RepID=F5L3C0_CALTT|nr:aspartyl-phosphate phosphatase Spo0E family protein [Caldalkalibacillus thermarum]EGL84167.1 Sporulation stage 0, Spo0E-like regulatory phosphatase [Caldalkalibacillus thermarum TA2.A1]QZT33637.1 aspartyl-phosphate phosphatase Spo0E family protein [Caldalkalibacillus thermarum TA2.A1]